MNKISDRAALLIVDVQKAFLHPSWGRRNQPFAEENIRALLDAWRNGNRPVFFIKHVNLTNRASHFFETSSGIEFQENFLPQPGEPIIEKQVNSAFIGTDLESRLRSIGCDTVVVTGLTTNHCVETTTRMAGNLGFQTYLISDACATFDRLGPGGKLYTAEEIHQMTLTNLNEEFASILDTKSLLQML